jgi:hypothetical protein
MKIGQTIQKLKRGLVQTIVYVCREQGDLRSVHFLHGWKEAYKPTWTIIGGYAKDLTKITPIKKRTNEKTSVDFQNH